MKTSQPRRRLSISLQTKVLMLVLLPLLLVTLVMSVLDARSRIHDSRDSLAKQRENLIQARQQAVRDVVQMARSAIAPIYDNAGPNDRRAQERAAEMLRAMRFEGDNYIFVYDYDGTNIVLPHAREREGTDMSGVRTPAGDYLVLDMIEIAQAGGGFYEYPWEYPGTDEPQPKHSYIDRLDKWGWLLGAGVYVTDVDATMAELEAASAADLRRALISSTLTGLVLFAIVAAIALALVRRTVQPIRRTAAAMQDIAQGRGDLTRRLEVESNDEIGNLATQFNAFVSRMQETLRQVRTSTVSVHHAAGEIAQGSTELASRTEQAAANLQETAASMEEITATVNHSAQSAQQANQLAQSTAGVARQGEQAMGQVERTMSDINDSATRISDIINMIDSIAFQTNILALNASVEAARAGEHGRGFAVVAQEVRTLASRSSDASREIRTLIDTSVAHTQSGTELVRRAGQTMQEIVASVAQVTDVIGEISAGAKEQSNGIGQINTAVAEMDTMTQQNAAMVQQSSSAATDMSHHAERLNELINSFVLGEDVATEPRTSPARPANRMPSHFLPSGASRQPRDEAVAEWESF